MSNIKTPEQLKVRFWLDNIAIKQTPHYFNLSKEQRLDIKYNILIDKLIDSQLENQKWRKQWKDSQK